MQIRLRCHSRMRQFLFSKCRQDSLLRFHPPLQEGLGFWQVRWHATWEAMESSLQLRYWLSTDVASEAQSMMHGMGLRLGHQDKATFELSAICKTLDDTYGTQKVVFGDRFSVRGGASSPLQAKASVVLYIRIKLGNVDLLIDGDPAAKAAFIGSTISKTDH